MKKNLFSTNHSNHELIKRKLFNIIKIKRKTKRDKRHSNKYYKYENIKYSDHKNNLNGEKITYIKILK